MRRTKSWREKLHDSKDLSRVEVITEKMLTDITRVDPVLYDDE